MLIPFTFLKEECVLPIAVIFAVVICLVWLVWYLHASEIVMFNNLPYINDSMIIKVKSELSFKVVLHIFLYGRNNVLECLFFCVVFPNVLFRQLSTSRQLGTCHQILLLDMISLCYSGHIICNCTIIPEGDPFMKFNHFQSYSCVHI